MAAKKTMVGLTDGLRVVKFEISHAERLLGWSGSGWTLADACYELVGGELRKVVTKKSKDA